MTIRKTGAVVLLALGASLSLAACADDEYSRGYTSMSFGVSSGDDYGYHHRPWRYRDSDGDGVPNRYDPAPYDPYVR